MKQTISILFFAMLMICSTAIYANDAQRAEETMQRVRSYLAAGNCDRAQTLYNAWTGLTGRTDDEIVRQIAECRNRATRPTAPLPIVIIDSVQQTHNVDRYGLIGMEISVSFSVSGMLNRIGQVSVNFFHRDGRYLIGVSNEHRSITGRAGVWRNFTPNYQNDIFSNFVLFMPYRELGLSSAVHNKLKFDVGIFDEYRNQLDRYDFVNFWFGREN